MSATQDVVAFATLFDVDDSPRPLPAPSLPQEVLRASLIMLGAVSAIALGSLPALYWATAFGYLGVLP